jgi:putative transposase
MARIARFVLPEYPHHIVQRGNRRLDVFFNDDDRHAYLAFLRNACEKHGVTIWAYCLMSNHVHFVAVPQQEDSLARCFSDAHVRYTRRINSRKGWTGHLWQARFGSNVLDERHLIASVRYIERNPVRAGIVHNPCEYPWSSAPFHVGQVRKDPLVNTNNILSDLIGDWRDFLLAEDNPDFLKRIRRESYVNRPLGDASFIKSLEERLQCKLTRRRAGRPPKRKNFR